MVFQSLRPGEAGGLRVKSASGTIQDEPLLALNDRTSQVANDWSSDGRFVVYEAAGASGRGGSDLWILPVSDAPSTRDGRAGIGEGRKPFPFVQAPGQQNRAVFAPDGHWIAHSSDESGIMQVMCNRFRRPGRFQVSRNGGAQAQWRADGKELFFVVPDGTVMSAPIDTTREFEAGTPVALFNTGAQASARRQHAVSRDGQRFLAIVPERTSTGSPLTVVVNWLAAVQK